MPNVATPNLFRNHVLITPSGESETLLDIETDAITALYRKYGALLLRGFPLDVETFAGLTQTFCTHAVMNDSPGREMVDRKAAIQSVDQGDAAFPLHAELAREPWKPDICFFGCVRAPESGGETTFCDGVRVVKKLPRSVVKKLQQRQLRYIKRATDRELAYWIGYANPRDKALQHPPPDCPFEFSRLNNTVVRSFQRPFLHRTMFGNELCFGNFLLFARDLHKVDHYPVFEDNSRIPDDLVDTIRRTSDRLTEAVQWQKGDLLILDNTRFMHGRNAIEETGDRYIITYFGFLKFAVPSPDEGPAPRWRNPRVWRQVNFGN